jgi:hypothetical protein
MSMRSGSKVFCLHLPRHAERSTTKPVSRLNLRRDVQCSENEMLLTAGCGPNVPRNHPYRANGSVPQSTARYQWHAEHWLARRLADHCDYLLFRETLRALLPPNREPISPVIHGPKSPGQLSPSTRVIQRPRFRPRLQRTIHPEYFEGDRKVLIASPPDSDLRRSQSCRMQTLLFLRGCDPGWAPQ